MPFILLTMGDLLVRVQVFVHIHSEIHHVGVAEQIQLALEEFLLIVNLNEKKYVLSHKTKGNIYANINYLISVYCTDDNQLIWQIAGKLTKAIAK